METRLDAETHAAPIAARHGQRPSPRQAEWWDDDESTGGRRATASHELGKNEAWNPWRTRTLGAPRRSMDMPTHHAAPTQSSYHARPRRRPSSAPSSRRKRTRPPTALVKGPHVRRQTRVAGVPARVPRGAVALAVARRLRGPAKAPPKTVRPTAPRGSDNTDGVAAHGRPQTTRSRGSYDGRGDDGAGVRVRGMRDARARCRADKRRAKTSWRKASRRWSARSSRGACAKRRSPE